MIYILHVFFYILFGLMQTTFAETRLEIDPKNGNNNCIAQILSTQVAKAGFKIQSRD